LHLVIDFLTLYKQPSAIAHYADVFGYHSGCLNYRTIAPLVLLKKIREAIEVLKEPIILIIREHSSLKNKTAEIQFP